MMVVFFFFQAEDGIRDGHVTGVQTCALPILEARIPWLMRGKDYGLLDLAPVKARLALPADEQFVHPESGVCRDLVECGELPVTAEGHRSRVIIATHPAGTTASPIGVTRDGIVYELFFTALPALGFTAADVVKLYLHRGSFETVLSDEDREQDSDWQGFPPQWERLGRRRVVVTVMPA